MVQASATGLMLLNNWVSMGRLMFNLPRTTINGRYPTLSFGQERPAVGSLTIEFSCRADCNRCLQLSRSSANL